MSEVKKRGKKKAQEQFVPSTLFSNMDYPISDEVQANKSVRPLDLFKDVFPAIERKDYAFYSRLTPEQQKSYSPYVIQRWMSNAQDYDGSHHYYVGMVNDFVNVDFWSLSQHPELQHMLLCCAAIGNPSTKHNWLPFITGKRKKSAIRDIIKTAYPLLIDDEIDIVINNTTDAEFEEYLKGLGYQDGDLKATMKQWKTETKA